MTLPTLLLIIIFIIIIWCLYTHERLDKHTNDCTVEGMCDTISQKPYMWVYWELVNGATSPPPYIMLCMEIMKKNMAKTFNVVFLNEKTVFDYLPDLRKDINDLPIALKTDYVRINLLTHYGGLWLDADTIVMTDLREIAQKLNEGVDYIGAGCTGAVCLDQEGYGKPSNQFMGSVKNGKLVSRCLHALNMKLNAYYQTPLKDRKEFDYFDLGKKIIWTEYQQLKKEDPEYVMYHVPSYADGTRDADGHWIAMDLIFPKPIKYSHRDKLMVVMMVNSSICGKNSHYNWFCGLDRSTILSGNYFVSGLFNTALSYDPAGHTKQ